jgi:hypothetical protein
MFQDFNELLSIFNAHNVKYLVVGGYAVSFHAQPRATKDIDLLIKPDTENAKAVYMAMAKFGSPMEGLAPSDFSQSGKFFRMGREPVAVDILTQIDGVDFDRAWERRVEGIVDTATGLNAHFISGADLIDAKIAAGRPQDLADVEALRKATRASS